MPPRHAPARSSNFDPRHPSHPNRAGRGGPAGRAGRPDGIARRCRLCDGTRRDCPTRLAILLGCNIRLLSRAIASTATSNQVAPIQFSPSRDCPAARSFGHPAFPPIQAIARSCITPSLPVRRRGWGGGQSAFTAFACRFGTLSFSKCSSFSQRLCRAAHAGLALF